MLVEPVEVQFVAGSQSSHGSVLGRGRTVAFYSSFLLPYRYTSFICDLHTIIEYVCFGKAYL